MGTHELPADHGAHPAEAEELLVTRSDYVRGFILAVLLTVAAFWLVMGDVIQNRATLAVALGVLAAVQILVHMVYFLHMNGRMQGGWTLLSTIFAAVFVVVTLAGTLWVMFHMNAHMMPDHANPMARSQPAQERPALPGAAP